MTKKQPVQVVRGLGINHIHHYLGTTLDAAALVLNGLLLYLILHYSRFQIKAFKHVFLLTCVGDALLSAIVLFGQPVQHGQGWDRVSVSVSVFR